MTWINDAGHCKRKNDNIAAAILAIALATPLAYAAETAAPGKAALEVP